ncbi:MULTISPECIES: thioredoxin family protein [Marinobacter]|uniref:thioredoxin family protein n=1 Tax=Marinobacter TaxID=2742 RepID=UPI0010AA79FB|nr:MULTISPECIES: co-chaperone YbbN [Marinobacter]MBJ7300504.1 co-chaperone YbbN [Marinobacter salarius]MDC8457172.1 co-chaperone YbbN [Marinobacter sp. DS40M6]VVT20311.1 Thioredoxin domain-containing protein [Marinobacter salarius]HIO31514.1 co-chaperone YbbN [Marinobacter salarius]HIO99321.1 co-chaperone YbbN [Marinobacter salarius]
MSNSPYVFEATMDNFQQDVMEASSKTPILIDVWAEWCAPCKQLMPLLEKLADEYKGGFMLAKVNADEQQQLTGSLGVRSLPTVILVKDGQAVDGFNGALQESEIRKVLDKHIEMPEDEEAPYDKAHRLWEEGDVEAALAVLTEMNRSDPDDLKVLIDLAQLKAELGDLETAEQVLESLPPEEKMQHQAKQLAARLKFLRASAELPPIHELEDALDKDPKDPNALHLLALHHILQENNAEAMELLIRLMRVDSKYKDEVAKTTLIELFDKLGNNNPDVRTYRRKLYTLMH